VLLNFALHLIGGDRQQLCHGAVKRAGFISVFRFVFVGDFLCCYALHIKPLLLKLQLSMNVLIAYLLGILTAAWDSKKPYRTSGSNPKSDHEEDATKLSSGISPQIPPATIGHNQASEKNKWWPNTLKEGVEVLGLLVLIVYTGATIAIWNTSTQQLKILSDSRDRAWIKFSENTITLDKGVVFKASVNDISIGIEHVFQLENLGKLPASNYSLSAEPIYFEVNDSYTYTHTNWKQRACDVAGNKLVTVIDGLIRKGNVMFPGLAMQNASEELSVPNTVQKIAIIHIAACVVYMDVNGDLHQTAVLYCNSSGKPARVLDRPEVWWNFQTASFKACMAYAD
jgi:hypothetical protein